MAADPVIPPPLDDDDDDVAWALQTAAVQWNRGARADAVVWLRRAVDAAIACGSAQRTKDLTRLAAAVADSLVAEAMAQPDSAAPPARDSAPSPVVKPSPNPRHSLTGEIPFEIEGAERYGATGADSLDTEAPADTENVSDTESPGDTESAADTEDIARDEGAADTQDDFDDEAPTIPPPSNLALVQPPVSTHASGEYSVDAGELLPESIRGSAASVEAVALSTDGLPRSHEPTMVSETAEARSPSEAPTLERNVDSVADEIAAAAALSDDQSPAHDAPTGDTASEPEHAPASIEPTLVAAQAAPLEAVSEPTEEGAPTVDGVRLDEVRGFEDLPEDAQRKLAQSAVVTELSPEEEVSSFSAALVTAGRVGIMPAIADVAAGIAQRGDVVFTRGTLEEGVLLRVVALQAGTRVATWSSDALGSALADCPWVGDELRLVADRFQALAGSVLGALGDRLDDSLRGLVMPKLEVRAYGPGEIVVEQGKSVPGLHVVGAGRIELIENGAVADELAPGDFLFAAEVLSAGKAHATARAGRDGALLMVASRVVAHELLVSVPPLLEILAG